MHRLAAALVFAALLAAPSAAAQGGASALTRAVAASNAAKVDYRFDLELRSGQSGWLARFDPTSQQRLTLVSPERDELSAGARRAFESYASDVEGLSWCANDYIARVTDMRPISENETSVTYAFQPTPESIRSESSRRYARHMRGEMTVSKQDADITAIRLFSPQAFSPMPMVRLSQVNITFRCVPAPNGRHYAAEVVTEMRGSAFGQNVTSRSVQRASNLSAP